MRRLRVALTRLAGIFNKDKRHLELAQEIESHIQFHTDDNVNCGMNLGEARREALIRLGGVEQTKEIYREQRGLPTIETILQDLRYEWHASHGAGSQAFLCGSANASRLGMNASRLARDPVNSSVSNFERVCGASDVDFLGMILHRELH